MSRVFHYIKVINILLTILVIFFGYILLKSNSQVNEINLEINEINYQINQQDSKLKNLSATINILSSHSNIASIAQKSPEINQYATASFNKLEHKIFKQGGDDIFDLALDSKLNEKNVNQKNEVTLSTLQPTKTRKKVSWVYKKWNGINSTKNQKFKKNR